MKSFDISVMGADPDAFYGMCLAERKPIALTENGERKLVAMSVSVFNEFDKAMCREEQRLVDATRARDKSPAHDQPRCYRP